MNYREDLHTYNIFLGILKDIHRSLTVDTKDDSFQILLELYKNKGYDLYTRLRDELQKVDGAFFNERLSQDM